MFSHSCGRDSVMLAFGGGVMGDLCGYVASGYMRGIPFVQLPTSFLAMVDSSIGGKTGIDTPAGKNLLGAFHRPLAVLIDLSLLLTLPQRELCNGMAESIKAGLIASAELFELMETNAEGLLKHKDLSLLAQVVQRSVAIKAHVVLNDEREAGLRSILNFGHSIGHAVEALSQPHLLHGECVAIGMMEEIILARGYGLVGSGELRRVDNILKGRAIRITGWVCFEKLRCAVLKAHPAMRCRVSCCAAFSLPTRIPSHLSPADLLAKMSIDKKVSSSSHYSRIAHELRRGARALPACMLVVVALPLIRIDFRCALDVCVPPLLRTRTARKSWCCSRASDESRVSQRTQP